MSAKEWLDRHKKYSPYDLEDYDEGGYLGINEENLHEIMEEYAKNSELIGTITSHISKLKHIDDNYCLINMEAPTDYMRGRHAAYDEIIQLITSFRDQNEHK